jgi:phage-related protein
MDKATYVIEYYSEQVQAEIETLPETIGARYIVLMRRMWVVGPNLGGPHTKALGDGLFEMRLKGAEGIGRVFFCARIGRRIVMLHSFVKKSEKTPLHERRLAEQRLKEVRNENP